MGAFGVIIDTHRAMSKYGRKSLKSAFLAYLMFGWAWRRALKLYPKFLPFSTRSGCPLTILTNEVKFDHLGSFLLS